MIKHQNNGNCPECEIIFNAYPDFNTFLKDWFKKLQVVHPEAHISCAGRGQVEQERDFARGSSRDHWTQSAHNYNCAIDLWRFLPENPFPYNLGLVWFNQTIRPALNSSLEWYGAPGARYKELPHVQIANWESLVVKKEAKLVE